MLTILINTVKIIFLLGFLVLIHEGGHFLVAKACKVKVNEFAIGFGPTLFRKTKGDTKYALRLIPLGGFVSLEGEEERSEEEGSFSNTSIPKRIAIVLAGGVVNIIFGVLVFFILSSSTGKFTSNIVDYPIDNYAAKGAGIISGDKILAINDKKVNNASDINKCIQNSNGEKIILEIERNNEILNIDLEPTVIKIKDIGIYFNKKNDEESSCEIAGIEKDSPAFESGLKEKDKIISINNNDVKNDIYEIIKLIQTSKEETINIKVIRDENEMEFNIIPDVINNYYLGLVFKNAENTFINNVYYGLSDTGDFIISIFDNLKELFSGKVSTDQMVGIVGISDVVVSTSGISEYIYMLALISVSLGITNLLPFPPLDGGKVVIYLIEAIRRKPISEKLEINLQMIGFALLIILSIYVTYNDILRII